MINLHSIKIPTLQDRKISLSKYTLIYTQSFSGNVHYVASSRGPGTAPCPRRRGAGGLGAGPVAGGTWLWGAEKPPGTRPGLRLRHLPPLLARRAPGEKPTAGCSNTTPAQEEPWCVLGAATLGSILGRRRPLSPNQRPRDRCGFCFRTALAFLNPDKQEK